MFRVIDGDNDWLDLTPTFIELYNNPEISVRKIQEKLEISIGTYRKLRRHCIENKLIKSRHGRKPSAKPVPKFYSTTKQKGIDYFHVTKKGVFYASFRKARQAERMVELLDECGWDYNLRYELKKQVLEEEGL